MKLCSKCKKEKGLTCFYKNKSCKDGHCYQCKDCHNSSLSKYRKTEKYRKTKREYQKNSEKWKASHKKHCKTEKHKKTQYKAYIKHAYGISKEKLDSMLNTQENKCKICKLEFKNMPHVDHCHETSKIRGLLCRNCNRGLGEFKDNIAFLENAIGYLEVAFAK